MQGSDPISGMRFALEIDGIEVAWFSSCRGLAAKRGTFEIEEGGLNDRVHVRVGAEQPGQVTLEAPTSVSQALWAWRDASSRLEAAGATSVAIRVYDDGDGPGQHYELVRAWPAAWSGVTLDAQGDALALTAVEVAHEGVRRVA